MKADEAIESALSNLEYGCDYGSFDEEAHAVTNLYEAARNVVDRSELVTVHGVGQDALTLRIPLSDWGDLCAAVGLGGE